MTTINLLIAPWQLMLLGSNAIIYSIKPASDIVFDLINNGKYYFLSRPRRFGKSLFRWFPQLDCYTPKVYPSLEAEGV
ncbi:AAA family ATPase [Desulfobulbus sp. TB]|nr:AAA family ATPase [Desulfobulbus sp. TB]